MENRTVIFKDMISKLEALSTENYNYADMQKLISTAKTVLDASKTIMESVKDVKTQLKNQFEDQSKKFVDLSNEKVKKDLGIDRTGIEEVINKKENEDDFERIIDIGKKIMEYECRKTPFFSEERKQTKQGLNSLVKAKEGFNECFDMLNKMINLIETKIKLHKIDQGNISLLTEINNIAILLGKDEKCYIKIDGAELYEDRAVRDTVGGYDGFSFRIARGVSYRIGGFSARGESHMEKRLIDKGTFYITNKRYIFDGSSKNIEGDLKKVISVEAYSDGIKISRANKRDEVFAGDMDGEYIGAVISGIVKNIK